MNILFRCDGSLEIGMGHVIRCLALADELHDNHNCNISFAMRKSELGINKVTAFYTALTSGENVFDYVEWLLECIRETKSHILILDVRDKLLNSELVTLKTIGKVKIVTIDDPEDKRLEADLAFYPPVPQIQKLNWDGFGGELHVGWEYVILRKEFLKHYAKVNSIVPNILVTMGGTDENNMTNYIIGCLKNINEQFRATILVGSGYPYLKQLEKSLKYVEFEFKLSHNPENIAEVMSQADFSIISFGQTAYELAALKIPSVYVCLTIDHLESSKLFTNSGIGISTGVFSKEKEQEVIKVISLLLNEKQTVKKMAKHANRLRVSDLNKISKLIVKEQINV
jgi:UDP-2,4-diacetamido-2,4,6-trideoxy-beta-L-altropyranose hydrolase